MKRFSIIWTTIAMAIIAFVLARGYPGSGHGRVRGADPRSGQTDLTQGLMIQSRVPERRDFQLSTTWLGRVVSQGSVKLIALEAGRVESIEVHDEDAVKKGTPLFSLGGSQISSRLMAAKAKIASLRLRVTLARETVKHKHKAAAQKLVSLDELESAEGRLAQTQADLDVATLELQTVEDRTRIRAPINGIFTHRVVSVGQEVEKGAPLAEIIDPSHLRIEATVFPAGDVQLQGKAAIVRTYDGLLTAVVSRILPERTSTGGTAIWIEGDGLDRYLRPGETSSGEIILEIHKSALALPRSAIVYDEQERPYVFVRHGEAYNKQPIQVGLESDAWVEIVSGLATEDQVVTKGAYELFYRDFNKIYKVTD